MTLIVAMHNTLAMRLQDMAGAYSLTKCLAESPWKQQSASSLPWLAQSLSIALRQEHCGSNAHKIYVDFLCDNTGNSARHD